MNNRKPQLKASGFTITELMVAAFIGILISGITFNAIISNSKSNALAELTRRIKEDWIRAENLIESEIAIGESIRSGLDINSSIINQNDCSYLYSHKNNLKLQINLPGNTPDITYGVITIQQLEAIDPTQKGQWMGGQASAVLIRCGPQLTISADGSRDYKETTPFQQAIIIDNLDVSGVNEGLNVSQPRDPSSNKIDNEKIVDFSLSLIEPGLSTNQISSQNTFTLGESTFSRVQQIPPVPEQESICSKICLANDQNCSSVPNDHIVTLRSTDVRKYQLSNVSESGFKTTTVCTNRELQSGDSIQGGDGNYVIDGNPVPNRTSTVGITIIGGSGGRNLLLGTPQADTITGGNNDDALVGRDGADELNGGGGDDSFLPWESSAGPSVATINGGAGFDRLYIKDSSSNFSSSGCTRSSCELKSSDESTTKAILLNTEMIVYRDTSIELPETE